MWALIQVGTFVIGELWYGKIYSTRCIRWGSHWSFWYENIHVHVRSAKIVKIGFPIESQHEFPISDAYLRRLCTCNYVCIRCNKLRFDPDVQCMYHHSPTGHITTLQLNAAQRGVCHRKNWSRLLWLLEMYNLLRLVKIQCCLIWWWQMITIKELIVLILVHFG